MDRPQPQCQIATHRFVNGAHPVKPAASVVMTVYKDFRFLDEAVESVLLQDFPDIELILVDDGNYCDEMLGAWPAPETDVDIRWTILFHNPFFHSAIAFRKSLFKQAGRYRPHELISQDHYLWFDMLPFCRAMNVPEPLTRYRINSQGLSYTDAANARARTHEIRRTSWRRLGLEYNLYDDAVAADISEWVRGGELPVEKRAAAYVQILRILRAFVDASSPRIGPRYRTELQQLVTTSIERMLRRPPAGWRDLMSTLRGCSSLGRLQTAKSLVRELIRRRDERTRQPD
jgi:hypothetical protein